MAVYDSFQELDVRVGTIVEVQDFVEARNPSYKLLIDLGDVGVKKSCAQITQYDRDELVGMQVLCLTNVKPRQIGPALSEVLTLGVDDAQGNCVLITPEQEVENGSKMY